MVGITIGDVTFEIGRLEAPGALALSSEGRAPITLWENVPDSKVLEEGHIPDATQSFIARHLLRESDALEAARVATALQMWAEYDAGWRAAGGTQVADKAAFARALGIASLSLFLDPDGQVSMAELHWADRELFLGHSVSTSVFDPEGWREFDATMFG